MTYYEFAEKVWEGGYHPTYAVADMHRTLLDVEAWKAVGKVEGWDKRRERNVRGVPIGMVCYDYNDEFGSCDEYRPWYLENMHRMIDALAEGKTIEQYLETL